MMVQVMSRLCGYTSAGAGPVSLGLVVTMLALLLTCRGQCRGDMTNIHFTLVHAHWLRSGYGRATVWLRSGYGRATVGLRSGCHSGVA